MAVSVHNSQHPEQSAAADRIRAMMARLVPFAVDMGIATIGVSAGAATQIDWVALSTAISAGIYLICKGIVLVIREIRKKK